MVKKLRKLRKYPVAGIDPTAVEVIEARPITFSSVEFNTPTIVLSSSE